MAETKTHWKKMTNTKYLGAWDLGDKDMIVRITDIREEMVKDNKGQEEKVLIAYLDGNVKPLILNKTNCKSITRALGSPYIEDWAGHKIQLYSDKVPAFGEIVDAIRVREFNPEVN